MITPIARMKKPHIPKRYDGSDSPKMCRKGQLKRISPMKNRKDHISLLIREFNTHGDKQANNMIFKGRG
jgi:hypothetical protein